LYRPRLYAAPQATAKALDTELDSERTRRRVIERECADLGIAYERCDETLTETMDALAASKAEVAGLQVCTSSSP